MLTMKSKQVYCENKKSLDASYTISSDDNKKSLAICI